MALLSTTDFPHLIVETEGFAHKRIDLHSHTHCSDGSLSPQSLIDRAANFQIDVLAITDHDTVAGLDIAQKHIDDKKIPLRLISGIEISTAWQGFEIHIVGLNIDKNNVDLQNLITWQQAAREQRAISMGDKLAKCGFTTIYDDAKELAGEGSITRAHFAKVLHQQGHVSTMQQAFDKYIGKKGSKGQRAYVKPNWCSIEEAVQAIHQAGGSAVMAHPIRYDLSAKWLRRLIVDFSEAAGDGLEIVLPQMNLEQRKKMLAYCQEYDLYASMGSDFHHPNKWSDIGRNLTMPVGAKPIWAQWQ
ncbi:PHP domain-containing protein [Colwellia ponticola]|uniref:PHP domain-containing protein n=1 Tax=Colwellia ponticola TaxID=2304625 RepID=A0A8H2PLP5_9GAMM|nr:PHP domain-containing protein [Colwellia ponticola]TMM42636.1 PHP domain-containing protein [Colwellia ponticola]